MLSVAIVFVLSYFGIIKNEYISTFLIQIVIMFAIPLLLHKVFVTKSFKQTFKQIGFCSISLKMLGITIVLGFCLYFFNLFVATSSQTIIRLFGYETLPFSTNTISTSYGQLFKEFALSCLLPGICEEVLHRGIMLMSRKEYSNTRFCLITSSILFGLMHLNINQFFYAALLGGMMGYVSLVSGSIIPSIIIHFMNNFFSTYFSYGLYLDLPFTKLFYQLETFLYSNILLFLAVSIIGIWLILIIYKLLTKQLAVERIRRSMKKVVDELNLSNAPLEEAEQKICEINSIIKNSDISRSEIDKHSPEKTNFTSNIFLIGSFILGTLVTICSFIWGLL